MAQRDDTDSNVVTKTRTQPKEKLQRPKMFRVMLHNDDYTSREFVVEVLRHVFRRSENESVQIMLHVHNNGVGVAGVYTHEVAEVKVRKVEHLARQREFPLMLTIEPDD